MNHRALFSWLHLSPKEFSEMNAVPKSISPSKRIFTILPAKILTQKNVKMSTLHMGFTFQLPRTSSTPPSEYHTDQAVIPQSLLMATYFLSSSISFSKTNIYYFKVLLKGFSRASMMTQWMKAFAAWTNDLSARARTYTHSMSSS